MISATIGIPGAGKSFWAVKHILDYIGAGGVVFTNIKLTGLYESEEAGFFHWKMFPDAPAIKYLKKCFRWNYCEGQYSYIPLDQYDHNFLKLLPHGAKGKPILLILDEVNLWFDSLDRGKLSSDAKYREMFDFLRLSRHYHVDVNFLLQDFSTLNTRLRGLCAKVVKCTDMQSLKIKGVPVPFPFKWFLWQEYDAKGRNIVRTSTWYKDTDIFACYDSYCMVGESALSQAQIQTEFDGKQKRKAKKKMSVFERVVLYGSLCALGWLLWDVRTSQGLYALRSSVVTNSVVVASNSVVRPSAPVVRAPVIPPARFLNGYFQYADLGNEKILKIDGVRVMVGRAYEWGTCISFGSDFAFFQGRGGDCWVYPRSELPEGVTSEKRVVSSGKPAR